MKLPLLAGLVAFALASAVTACSTSEDVHAAWENFKSTYGKQYRSLYEETIHKANFIENFNFITAHNEHFAQGLVKYTLKLNKHSDLSTEEFTKTFNGYKKSSSIPDIEVVEFIPVENIAIPDEFDWRDKGAVTPVKDQGQCGSCWTFSATGALEGQYFLKRGVLPSISEQNLVDCSKEMGNSGCAGGDMYPAYIYVHDNDGIDSEESYPYEAVDNVCRYDASANVTSTKGYATIENGNEFYLKAAVATKGPIAVAIDASHRDFSLYGGGVYYNEACSDGADDPENDLDHAVLAVGYGTTEDGEEYWLVKNSWGTDWGEDGYIKMARNRNNNCGIAAEASYPISY